MTGTALLMTLLYAHIMALVYYVTDDDDDDDDHDDGC